MASGDSLAIFNPYQNEPPSSNYATFDVRNQHPCLDFPDDANVAAVFSGVMPQNYDGGGVTVYIHYAMSSATSDTVDWDVAFELLGDQDQDLDSDGFAAVNSVDDTTVPATSGYIDVVSVAFTNGADMDSITAGDKYRIKITRDASSDDASGDAELYAVEIRET